MLASSQPAEASVTGLEIFTVSFCVAFLAANSRIRSMVSSMLAKPSR